MVLVSLRSILIDLKFVRKNKSGFQLSTYTQCFVSVGVLLCVMLCPKRVPELALKVDYLWVKNTIRSELMCKVGSRNPRPSPDHLFL